jgi:hypothetical protein
MNSLIGALLSKTVVGALVSVGVGTALGVVAVVGVTAAVDPTGTPTANSGSSQTSICVLEYDGGC